MQFLIDHITATMIGGTVLLILAVAQFRTNEAVVDQTSYYASKKQVLELTNMIESDFKNVGLGVPPGAPVFNEVTPTAIEFNLLLAPGDVATSAVRYEAVPIDTLELDGQSEPLFQLRRSVNGVLTGQSPPRMAEFVVELRNIEGNPVANPEDTETIHVHYALVPPFNADKGFIKKTYWTRTFLAPNL